MVIKWQHNTLGLRCSCGSSPYPTVGCLLALYRFLIVITCFRSLTCIINFIQLVQCHLKGSAYLNQSIFAQLMTMQKKQILARGIGIQKGNYTFFRDN